MSAPRWISTQCRCGGAIVQTTDATGYRMSIEQCEKNCGHWRVSDRGYVQPALKGRRGNGHLTDTVVAALPASADDALTPHQVAQRAGLPNVHAVKLLLSYAHGAGRIARRRVRTGRIGQPAYHYYRAVA